jgi:RNA polymerase sigma-70 factor (ECF subfamily)
MDNELFWTLLEPEHPRAEAFCRKLTQDRDVGDDLYQDALLTAMKKLGSLRDREAFRPWLYRIIVNAFKNRHRRSWWRRHASLNPDVPSASIIDDPRDRLTARRWLERAFRALNADERSLVVLFELEQWSLDELAGLYRSSKGAIKARLFRCRRKMRKELTRYLSQTENAQSLKEAEYALSRGETPVE